MGLRGGPPRRCKIKITWNGCPSPPPSPPPPAPPSLLGWRRKKWWPPWRRSAFHTDTIQPVNATYVAFTKKDCPRWPPGRLSPEEGLTPSTGERALSPEGEREGPSPFPLPPAGRGLRPPQGRAGDPFGARCQMLVAESWMLDAWCLVLDRRCSMCARLCSQALIEQHVRLRCHNFVGRAWSRCI